MSDNRDYRYKEGSETSRAEFDVIEEMVGSKKRVIDLGCGDGTLMQKLIDKGNSCKGVEISQSGVNVCKKKGLAVVKGRIDEKLPFKDKSFDFAICNVTLHMVMYPEVLIREMKRISKKQIITFPNFAFALNRLGLLFFGTFPKWSLFGYSWYSTGHIHQLSIKDFEQFCKANKITVIERQHLLPRPIWNSWRKWPIMGMFAEKFTNIFATMGVFVTK